MKLGMRCGFNLYVFLNCNGVYKLFVQNITKWKLVKRQVSKK